MYAEYTSWKTKVVLDSKWREAKTEGVCRLTHQPSKYYCGNNEPTLLPFYIYGLKTVVFYNTEAVLKPKSNNNNNNNNNGNNNSLSLKGMRKPFYF